jgi:hypothetical protein
MKSNERFVWKTLNHCLHHDDQVKRVIRMRKGEERVENSKDIIRSISIPLRLTSYVRMKSNVHYPIGLLISHLLHPQKFLFFLFHLLLTFFLIFSTQKIRKWKFLSFKLRFQYLKSIKRKRERERENEISISTHKTHTQLNAITSTFIFSQEVKKKGKSNEISALIGCYRGKI